MKQARETRALALLARIIGRKHGVEVEFSSIAQTASTDGKRIVLPVVSNLGTDAHAALIEGLVDHEAMHCRFTDFSVEIGKLEPIVRTLHNLIEDMWGEREQGKIYPGCARNIRSAMEVMIGIGWFRGPDEQESPAVMMTNFLVNGLRARLHKSMELTGFTAQYRVKLEALLGAGLVDRIWDTACKVDQVMSTDQALVLAEEIVDLLRDAMPTDSPPTQSGEQGKEGEGGEAADNHPTTQGSMSSSPSVSGDQKRNAIQQILDASNSDRLNSDMGDLILAVLNREKKAGNSAINTDHAEAGASGQRGSYSNVSTYSKSSKYHDSAVLMSRGIEIKLGNKLESLLEAQTDSFVLHKRVGRRLEPRRVPRLSTGKLDVFRTVEEGTEVDTAVFILIDYSSSMFSDFDGLRGGDAALAAEKRRVVAAAAVSYAAAQVLNRHNIPFGMAGYGGLHLPLKSFDDRWPIIRKRNLIRDLGGTSTDLAVLQITSELLSREEARKLVILVTDGQPNELLDTVVVMNEVRKLGIEFAVLFIGAGGEQFQKMLTDDGYRVAQAMTQESLAASFFEAVESAF